jgi:hypothetical protein
MDFFLIAFIAWDLLYINKINILEVRVVYPFLALIIPMLIILFTLAVIRLKRVSPKEESLYVSTEPSGLSITSARRCVVYVVGFISVVVGLYFLQIYRDSTRYVYYSKHSDHFPFTRYLVNAWEFLDKPDEKKIIAMAWDINNIPTYYPLFGKWLQNDITYISTKHKWEGPTRFDRGKLREDDFKIWLYNLERKKVDYILVLEPWPIEFKWIVRRKEFKLVLDHRKFKIFRYTGKNT